MHLSSTKLPCLDSVLRLAVRLFALKTIFFFVQLRPHNGRISRHCREVAIVHGEVSIRVKCNDGSTHNRDGKFLTVVKRWPL